VDKKEARKYSKAMLYSIATTKEVIETSKINLDNEDNTRVGVVIGSGIGGLEVWEEKPHKFYTIWTKKGLSLVCANIYY